MFFVSRDRAVGPAVGGVALIHGDHAEVVRPMVAFPMTGDYILSRRMAAVVHHSNFGCSTSAEGHKQTLRRLNGMSALPPKADIAERHRNVR
jgi:hypothetical protein